MERREGGSKKKTSSGAFSINGFGDIIPEQYTVVVFFNKFIYLIYLFLPVLGLCCCAQAFSSCGELGLLFVAVCRLLIAVASLLAEHRL